MNGPTFEGNYQSLFAAVAKAQAQMGGAVKGSVNPHWKQSYADLKSVLQAILPALNANGLAIMQFPGFDTEHGLPTLTTVLVHEEGGRITSTAAIPIAKADPQGYGSAITYLRRYSAQAALALPAVDDDGEAAQGRPVVPRQKQSQPAPRRNGSAETDPLVSMVTGEGSQEAPAPRGGPAQTDPEAGIATKMQKQSIWEAHQGRAQRFRKEGMISEDEIDDCAMEMLNQSLAEKDYTMEESTPVLGKDVSSLVGKGQNAKLPARFVKSPPSGEDQPF